jgi:2-oxoglutarate ferredoxin oxidoreductase subunit alpha
MPVLAPSSPGDCFHIVLEAFRLAVKYMTPVTVLSDGYLANSSEPWKLPKIESLVRAPVKHHKNAETFSPYKRDPETLARPWTPPGTAGCEHRIGGIEKDYETGNVSYDNKNHHKMMEVRAAKIAGMVRDIPDLKVTGPDSGKLLIVGWGNTAGVINEATEQVRNAGLQVSSIHLRHLNPFPANLGEILKRFERILVPELNMGQLIRLLRAEFLVPAEPYTKVAGRPLRIHELVEFITNILKEKA